MSKSAIRKKYDWKKKQTLEQRSVGFELSFEEYKSLRERGKTCDYTGVVFDKVNLFSIERIDVNKPYRADNCCCVTAHANLLKDRIDKGYEGKISLSDIDLVNKIKHTLATKTTEELTRKYRLTEQIEDATMAQEPGLSLNSQLLDVVIAKSYIAFSEAHTDSSVGFSKYKRLFIRKSCEWSGKVFDEDNNYLNKVFIKKDETLPFNDDNIMVVCRVLNTIKFRGLFTSNELLKYSKNL